MQPCDFQTLCQLKRHTTRDSDIYTGSTAFGMKKAWPRPGWPGLSCSG